MKFFNAFLLMFMLVFCVSPLFGFLGEFPEQGSVPGEALIKFSASVESFQDQVIDGRCEIGIPWFDSLSTLYGIYDMHKVFSSDDPILSRIWKIYFPETSSIVTITSAFEIQEDIVYAEANCFYHFMAVPNDPLYDTQWAHINYLDSELAWDIETGSDEVIVGIIDSGADLDHPDLIGMFTDPFGYNWGEPEDEPWDSCGHGTHCAGIIAAATNNAEGVAGMAGGWGPGGVSGGVRMMILKCFKGNFAPWEWLALAIEYAATHPSVDNHCDIISMSWGGDEESQIVYDAIEFAYNQNCVLVAAAGNNGMAIKFYPAAWDECIAVASTEYDDHRSCFSEYGNWVDISAPGGTDVIQDPPNPFFDENDIFSTTPTYSTLLHTSYPYITLDYGFLAGTSMACPHVSGLAGLILSQYPDLTNEQVRERLCGTIDVVHYFYDEAFDLLGTGRINAYKALAMNEGPNIVFCGDTIFNPAGNENKTQAYVGTNNMFVCLGNVWEDANNVYATLSTPDPGVNISNGESFYGIMNMYEYKLNDIDPFIFTVSTNCLQGHTIQFQLYITADGEYEKTIDFDVTVGIPFQTGFPVDLGVTYSISSPVFVDLDYDGLLEIMTTATVTDGSKLFAINGEGTIEWEYFASASGDIVSTPAVGDIDNDGLLDCIFLTADRTNRGFYIWGVKSDGELKFQEFFDTYSWYSTDISCPTLSNLDQDENLEIVVGTNAKGDNKIIVFDYNGTNLEILWQRSVVGAVLCSPATGDLNEDGTDDIVFGTTYPGQYKFYALNGTNGDLLDNWEKDMDCKVIGSPAIGDIDNDGQYDVIAVTGGGGVSGKVLVWNSSGTELWDFSPDNGNFSSSPALTDFNLDAYLESAVIDGFSRNRMVYGFDHEGNILVEYYCPGMRTIPNSHSNINSSPAIGDLNGDGFSDILISHPTIFYECPFGDRSSDLPTANILAISSSGTLLPAYPLEANSEIIGCPALLDIDNDKDIEVVVCSKNGELYAWDCDGTFDPQTTGWPMFHHDIWHTGRYDFVVPETHWATDSLATAYNNQRKIVDNGSINVVYSTLNKIFFTVLEDDNTLGQKRILGDGRFPVLSSYTDATDEKILAAIWVNNNVIYFSRHSDISGWSDPWHLIFWAGTKMHYSPPSLIIDNTGIGHFVWEIITEPYVYPGNITYQLHYSTFDAGLDQPNIIENEILDEAEEYVDEWTEGLELGCASIDLDDYNNPVVAWSRPLGEGKNTVYFKQKTGSVWPAEPEIVSSPEEVSIHPFCDIAHGKVNTVWEDEEVIKYRQRELTGSWGNIETVSDPYNYSRNPQILDGDICVYTEEPQEYPNHHSYPVYSERLDSEWSSCNIIESTPYYSEHPQSYIYENTPSMRILHTVWTEGNEAPYEVRYASVELFGSPLIIISGDVFESDGITPVLDPVVTIANLNTAEEWIATVEPGSNFYNLELSRTDVEVDDILRVIAKKELDEGIYDPDEYTYTINITDHEVTQDDISMGGINEDLNLDHYCINYYPDYPYHIKEADEYSGAAVMQMWVDFKGEGPYTQDDLYTWGLENNTEEDQTAGLEHIDPRGMALTLKDIITLPPGHTFTVGVMPGDEDGLNWAMHRICWWQYTGPGALPTGVNYENWMSVRGIHTDKRPQDGLYAGPGDWEYDVYGFWINDPTGTPPTGLGANSYKTADEWTSSYYTTIIDPNNPQWNGKYITVLEPPEGDAQIHIVQPIARFNEHQINALRAVPDQDVIVGDMKSWIIQAAINGVTEELIPYDENFKEVFEKTHPGDPFFVTSIDGDDYYAVPFIPDKPTLNPKDKITSEIGVDVVTKIKSNSDIKSTARTKSIPDVRNQAKDEVVALEDLILVEAKPKITVVILINAQDGSFREASWTDIPVEYLPILKEQAQQIAFDTAEEMGLEVEDINDLKPELIHRQASPYYPEWLVVIGEYAIYITQDGDVSVEEWLGGTVDNGGTMSQDGSASLTYGLNTALPTPFVKNTTISYSIAKSGKVSLNIYDVTGRLVRTLVNAKMDAGFYTLTWKGYDNNDQKLAHGVYFTRLKSGDFVSVKKVILVK